MHYPSLEPSRIRPAVTLHDRLAAGLNRILLPTDSASDALTDFQLHFPITVDAERTIGEAYRDMDRIGMHALLVTQQTFRRIDPHVVGLITSHDIERARAPRSHGGAGLVARQCLKVCEVMTQWDDLSYVKYESLQTLTAMDLYKMFQGTGLTHCLVIQVRDDEAAIARGILSRAAVGERLHYARQMIESLHVG